MRSNELGFVLQKRSFSESLQKSLILDSVLPIFSQLNQSVFIFSDKAEACLKESEKLLVECTEGDYKDNSTSLDCLRDIKTTSKDVSQQLSG